MINKEKILLVAMISTLLPGAIPALAENPTEAEKKTSKRSASKPKPAAKKCIKQARVRTRKVS